MKITREKTQIIKDFVIKKPHAWLACGGKRTGKAMNFKRATKCHLRGTPRSDYRSSLLFVFIAFRRKPTTEFPVADRDVVATNTRLFGMGLIHHYRDGGDHLFSMSPKTRDGDGVTLEFFENPIKHLAAIKGHEDPLRIRAVSKPDRTVLVQSVREADFRAATKLEGLLERRSAFGKLIGQIVAICIINPTHF